MKMRKIIAIVAAVLMLCSILPISAMAADTYTKASSIAAGDVVVLVYESGKMELSGISTTNTKYGIGTAYSDSPAGLYELTVEAGYTNGTYSFKCPNGQYLYWTSGNSLATNATKNSNTSWTVSFSGGNAVIANAKDSTRKIQWNTSSPRFACYSTSQAAVQLYKKEVASTECEHVWLDANCTTPKTCSECSATDGEALGHNYVADIIDATCTATGSAAYECSVCFDSYDEIIPVKPHTYVDGFCSECGAEMPLNATITFDANKTQRTEYSTTVQKWENEGLTLVNNKASSTNNVGDYSNPARFYKSSQIIISYPGMTSLVIDASGISSNGDWIATLNGKTYTVENGIYTITFNPPVNEVTLTAAAQVRANSITASAVKPDCEHDYVGVETQAPTCTVPGVMTYTCSKCEDSYTDTIAVIDHVYGEGVETQPADCTTDGVMTYTCNGCGITKTEAISATGHNFVDDVCSVCGTVKAYKATITFDADKTQRIEYSTSVQKWANEGLTLVNNKATSTTNIGDYSGRFYKNSEIIIAFPEMVTLIIDATDINADYLWDATLEAAGLSFTVENKIYTVTFAEPTDNITLIAANQVRANSITAKVLCNHVYDNEYDADCNKCGDIREVAAPIAFNGNSVSEDVEGLAFLFSVDAKIAIAFERITEIDYANSSFGEYKLNGMGALLSNGFEEIDIPAVYAWNYTDSSVSYAVRILELDEDFKKDCSITAKPYIVIEKDGEEITIYGEEQAASYNGILG